MIDAFKKGRIIIPKEGQFKKGEAHPRSKLSNKDVRNIRKQYKYYSLRQIAKWYNVDYTLIWQIIRRKIWS